MLAARVLLHAPFVRRLEIVAPDEYSSLQPRFFAAALRRSGAAVAELLLDGPTYNHLDLLFGLLAKSKCSLRVLDVNEDQLTESFQLAMSQCKGLECLTLHFYGEKLTYAGSLRGALPNLRRLILKGDQNKPVYEALLVDLLRGAAGSLRLLHLKLKLLPAVEAEVRRCERLLSLACDAANVDLLPGLPELRRLSLSTPYYEDPSYADSVAAATATLVGSEPLSSLRELSIHLNCTQLTDDERRELGALIDALESAANEVTSATLRCSKSFKFLRLLQRMRRLRSLHLPGYTSPEALAVATGLPELECLDAELTYRSKEERALCRAAVEAFKRDRPDVGGQLKIRKRMF